MDDYRVKVIVRNNLLLSAIEAAGYSSQAAFCKSCDLSITQVNGLVAMRTRPVTENGEFCTIAAAVMEALGAAPSDLWTDAQLVIKLKRNSSERTVNAENMQALLDSGTNAMLLPSPESLVEDMQNSEAIKNIIDSLSPREQFVIRQRNYEHKSLKEVGLLLGVTVERVRQIEAKALRKLRNPARSVPLRPLLKGANTVSEV